MYMKKLLHFLQYHNGAVFAVLILIGFSGTAFAANELLRESQSDAQSVQGESRVDTSLLREYDIARMDFNMRVKRTVETEEGYVVTYTYTTLAVDGGEWREVTREETLNVSAQSLSNTTLEEYVLVQLGEILAHERRYLAKAQEQARTQYADRSERNSSRLANLTITEGAAAAAREENLKDRRDAPALEEVDEDLAEEDAINDEGEGEVLGVTDTADGEEEPTSGSAGDGEGADVTDADDADSSAGGQNTSSGNTGTNIATDDASGSDTTSSSGSDTADKTDDSTASTTDDTTDTAQSTDTATITDTTTSEVTSTDTAEETQTTDTSTTSTEGTTTDSIDTTTDETAVDETVTSDVEEVTETATTTDEITQESDVSSSTEAVVENTDEQALAETDTNKETGEEAPTATVTEESLEEQSTPVTSTEVTT